MCVHRSVPDGSLLADKDYVLKSIERGENMIVDCRAEVYYKGIEASHGGRKGRMPGAKNIPYTSLYEKEPDKAQQLVLERGKAAKELEDAETDWIEATEALEQAEAEAQA